MNGFKRILIVSSEFPPGPGGIGNHAFNLAKYLYLNGATVSVMTVSDFVDESEAQSFDKVQDFEVHRFTRSKSRVETLRKRIKEINSSVRDKKFSHIIFSGRFSLISALFIKCNKSETKLIAIVHGGDVNASNGLVRLIVNRALGKMDRIIPVSNFSRSKISASVDPGKVMVIPNGFDFEKIESVKIDNRVSSNGKLNLVTVGTVWPRKGHHNVLRALPTLISSHSKINYGIIGRLADTSKVKSYFEDKDLINHLKIYGSISNEEMINVLTDSHIFIMLSESQSSGDFEGFGIAVIEANFFGLPAIGSKNSGLEESIQDGVTGVLVDPRSDREISDAVQKILNNYEEYSENAKAWARKHHWSEIIKKYLHAIHTIN